LWSAQYLFVLNCIALFTFKWHFSFSSRSISSRQQYSFYNHYLTDIVSTLCRFLFQYSTVNKCKRVMKIVQFVLSHGLTNWFTLWPFQFLMNRAFFFIKHIYRLTSFLHSSLKPHFNLNYTPYHHFLVPLTSVLQ